MSTDNANDPTTITKSTISDNSVPGTVGETVYLGDGGGIISAGCNPITLTNDTIASNAAANLGGGYFGTDCELGPDDHQTTAFLFDTIAGNSAASGGGNINTNDGSVLTTGESIVANGVSGGVEGLNCTFTDGGTLQSLGHNLIDDSSCGTPASTDIIGQHAQLGALGNNGGPTQTELPASASPAVGAIPAVGVHRHRGQHRPAGGCPGGRDQRLVHHRRGRGGRVGADAPVVQPQRVSHGGR